MWQSTRDIKELCNIDMNVGYKKYIYFNMWHHGINKMIYCNAKIDEFIHGT